MKPILSICIPTINRSELLEVFLENLEREACGHLGTIEIVVADNASTDSTRDVVNRSSLPIIYGRQESTVGFANNFLFAASMASGEFVWIIGDDDLVLPGGIDRILQSIADAPDVDYHYLNFGWLDCRLRTQIVREGAGVVPEEMLNRLQCRDTSWKHLQRLEELVFLPSDNPSASFAGVFCFVARRSFFIEAAQWLRPSNSIDGASTLIDDCYPHAMLSLPRVAGRPIAYIGDPCMMQGINGWEWGAYLYKNIIFGIHQFFEWLEKTSFSEDAMRHLWESYFQMTGRLFFRMLHYRDKHKGLDIVIKDAIASSAKQQIFWDAFMEESRTNFDIDYDARNLSEYASKLLEQKPSSRIGLWGVLGRGQRLVKFSPQLCNRLFWVADRDKSLHGLEMEGTQLHIAHPDSLSDANLDILIIGARKEFVDDIISVATSGMNVGAFIVSINGVVSMDNSDQQGGE